jgi:uncharacterized protein (TIGR02996 family)
MADSALLQAIVEEPDNDLHRLVYADWLMDQGAPLGEFIQLQYRLHHLARDDPNRAAAQQRADELLLKNRAAWLPPLEGVGPVEVSFQRGFPPRIHLTAASFLAHGQRLFELLPLLREVSLTEARSIISELAGCPALARIRRLTLQENNLDDEAIAVLARSPHLGRLVSLDLSHNQITATGIRSLGAANLPELRHFDLSANPVDSAGMQALAQGPAFATWKRSGWCAIPSWPMTSNP